jgi:hypothetical protein
MIKGKMCDRAMHVSRLPKGSVKFEILLASKVRAVVVAESSSTPEEVPGLLRLDAPLARYAKVASTDGAESSNISTIELWQRCLPDELVCKIGDVLQLDVHYYCPEKLYFARAVKIVTFRPMGREWGQVCSLKENGFGFVHSQLRGSDIYFKSSHVFDEDSSIVPEHSLKIGTMLTFDVAYEDTHSGGKLRCKRVMLENPAATKLRSDAASQQSLISRDVLGVVVRNTTKKDAPGLLRYLDPAAAAALTEQSALPCYDPEVLGAMSSFTGCSDVQSFTHVGLPYNALKNYFSVIEDKFAPTVVYKSVQTDNRDASTGYTIVVSKVSSAEKYEEWKAGLAGSADRAARDKDASRSNGDSGTGPTIQFAKDDYTTPDFGALANDLKVIFDVCWDFTKGKKMAKNIRLTDESITGAEDPQFGVVDVFVDKNERYGFIRVIPSDEKLFWHMGPKSQTSGTVGSEHAGHLMLGSEVRFSLRSRGGLRCATDIQVLPAGQLCAKETLPECCLGLVVDESQLVLLDVKAVALLCNKYLDLGLMQNALLNHRKLKSGAEGWSRANEIPQKLGKAGASGGASASENGAAVPDDSPKEEAENTDFAAKYFPMLPRCPLRYVVSPAAEADVPGTGAGSCAAGEVVACTLDVQWGLQRTPVAATVVPSSSSQEASQGLIATPMQAVKKKGVITKLKFRTSVAATAGSDGNEFCGLQRRSFPLIDFVEILAVGDSSRSASVVELSSEYYYCQFNELVQRYSVESNSREDASQPQVGDEVEFFNIPALPNAVAIESLAFYVKLLPKTAVGKESVSGRDI